ncbi:MAG: lipoate--protein ligase family protein [Opitutaceae bacterium]|nr:lipoate--protein ligase family protein [Opitutaceae bacterium]
MELHLLPARTADAAGNMAVDFLLLQRYPHPQAAVRYRHYDWRRPAFTFGYAQKYAFIRTRLPQETSLDVTRRATGGGLVDHRDDWTYALVLPREHPLWDRPGPVIYRAVHEALAGALNATGADVTLQRDEPETAPGVCFERPEVGDVVRARDGIKVAGAALKRGKHGLLLQGSIWRPFAGPVDWAAFEEKLPATFARALDITLTEPGWPNFDPDEEQALVDQYASSEWIEAR